MYNKFYATIKTEQKPVSWLILNPASQNFQNRAFFQGEQNEYNKSSAIIKTEQKVSELIVDVASQNFQNNIFLRLSI